MARELGTPNKFDADLSFWGDLREGWYDERLERGGVEAEPSRVLLNPNVKLDSFDGAWSRLRAANELIDVCM